FDPMVKGYYTEEFLELCQKQTINFDPATEDLETIQHHTVDFLGINQYFPKRVRAPRYQWNEETPFHPERFYDVFDLPGKKMNN
ncbi:family 1 glycosylhydrolase, partial [Enterococcus faecium]|uniref:family 1 glycosylhydrolase n=1 Tax=Enterococcus faecium TaxID=1352 RepID=UPI003CC5BA7A